MMQTIHCTGVDMDYTARLGATHARRELHRGRQRPNNRSLDERAVKGGARGGGAMAVGLTGEDER